jgi:DNA-binding MarR family transcriptional regulator
MRKDDPVIDREVTSEGSVAAAPETAGRSSPAGVLTASERRAWRAFISAHGRLMRRLELELATRSPVQLAELDVLYQLDDTPQGRLRMNELADRVLLSRAGITRLVDRLVADGLVARAKCPSDARGSFAVLTEKGRAALDDAMPEHLRAVKLHFLDSFTEPELESLSLLLDRDFPLD